MTPELPNSAARKPEDFFHAWQTVCEANLVSLLDNWENGGHYTSVIFGGGDRSIVALVGKKLGLECYPNYYSLDAVYFDRQKDAVSIPPSPQGSTWLQNIRIAFEHENYFESGLFKEVSHLVITRAELRVLVAYPEAYDGAQIAAEFTRLAAIVAQSGIHDPAFLLITGKRTCVGRENWSGIQWVGRKYTTTTQGWTEIAPT